MEREIERERQRERARKRERERVERERERESERLERESEREREREQLECCSRMLHPQGGAAAHSFPVCVGPRGTRRKPAGRSHRGTTCALPRARACHRFMVGGYPGLPPSLACRALGQVAA